MQDYTQSNQLLAIVEQEIAAVGITKENGIYFWENGNMQIKIRKPPNIFKVIIMEWHSTLFGYPECFRITLRAALSGVDYKVNE